MDASVLIAVTSAADPHHATARVFIRQSVVNTSLVIHPLTLAEAAVRPVSMGLGVQVRQAWELLGMVVTLVDADQPWRLADLRQRTRLPLPDCCVLDTALMHGARLATFDKRLAGTAAELGVELALT